MTFICFDRAWRSNKLTSPQPSEKSLSSKGNVEDYSLNILMPMKFCRDSKIKKRKQIQEACRQHAERMKELSKPRKMFYAERPMKNPAIPLECLIPRLCKLAKPKHVTEKYQRLPEDPITLPGKIQNWESHNAWLAKRSCPKKDFAKLSDDLFDANHFSKKITSCGMKRIQKLAKPSSRYKQCKMKPSGREFKNVGEATERILNLCKPKIRVDLQLDVRPLVSILKVSKSAMAYQASERIKNLALPKKHGNHCEKKGNRKKHNCKKCFYCCHSVSCETFLLDSKSSENNLDNDEHSSGLTK